ncbi:hypothetical protein PFLU4_34560 [Pseudomonas fluorescens]|nr:hypothetical protein PFLU4_34560 [Pseudomonas fluorescens]
MSARQVAGGVLEAEHAQLFWRRTDEGDASGLARLREGGVFREKAVAGMDRGRAAAFSNRQKLVHRQVSTGRRAFAQAVGFIGLQDMQAGGVGLGIHRDAFDLQLTQGPQDAAGDGATVGDQDFFEHGIAPSGMRTA